MSGFAHAQTPPDAGSLFSEQQRLQQRLPDRMPQVDRGETVRPALREPGGDRILIRQIRFSGAVDLVPEAQLTALVADAIGQELDFAGLEALAQRVTEHLKKAGFILARAYLPRQDVTEGELEIAILAGRLDSKQEPVKIVPGGKLALRIDPERLKAIAATKLKPGAVANENELQRALLLMNDLPGVTARSRLEPGSEPDTTSVVIDVEQASMLSMTTSLDNYGSRYTGNIRAGISLQADDPLGIGDRVVLSLTHADLSDNVMLNYSLPLGSEGLRLGVSASSMESNTGKELARLGNASESTTFGFNLSYPIIRSRQQNLSVTFAADERHYLDMTRSLVTNKRETRPTSIGINGDLLDDLFFGGYNRAGMAFVSGELDILHPGMRAGDAGSAKTQGRYSKFTWNASRLQRMGGSLSLMLAATGQYAGKNLDSSEKFALGGPTAIRAYAGGEASGDEGIVANIELRYELPATSWGQLQLSGFYDHGRIKLHHTPWLNSITNVSGRNIYSLSGIGFGIQLSKTGSHNISLTLAQRLGNNPGRSLLSDKDSDGLSEHTRAWLQAMLWF